MHPHLSKFRLLYPDYRPSCLQNLFIILASLIQSKTVNLYDIKDEVGKISEKHKIKSESHYRRVTRFFLRHASTSLWASVLKYGLSLIGNDTRLTYLDGTEWSIGEFKLHCLLLAVDYKGVAIPIYFRLYNHKGVLSEKERMDFMKSAQAFCGLSVANIIADREFIGDKWFTHFYDSSLHFVIRLRKGQYENNTQKSYESLEKKAIKRGRATSIVCINGLEFRLWIVKNAVKSEDAPLIYILTNLLDKKDAPDLYRLRWKIESLFKHLKTNGYNLEDLRMKNLNKIRLLVSIVILAYILSVLSAFEERKKQVVRKKKYKNKVYFDWISVFKQGQSLLKQRFTTLAQFLEIIQNLKIPELALTPAPM